jgi:two-component system chemotaxis sensor kinase CheA
MEGLLPKFLAETLESLELLGTELVKLERQPNDKPTLGSIFRHVHTKKGTCGFLGLARLERVAHAAENILGKHRDCVFPVTPGSITLILRAPDAIRSIVDGIQATGQEPPGDDAGLIAELTDAAEGRVAAAAAPVAEVVAEAIPVLAAAPAAAILATPASAAPAAEVAGEPAAAARVPEPAMQTIRVNVDVLEGLMTLVSELVLTRNRILQLARSEHAEVFTGPLQRLSHITSDLQEGVMNTRMQPIGNTWETCPAWCGTSRTNWARKSSS